MLEIMLFGSFFFGNEPEQMIFMLYTCMFIWQAAMRAISYPPIYSQHVLDVVLAANEASMFSEGDMPPILSLVPKKFCGNTIGEVAATCGISLAASAYFDIRRLGIFPIQLIDEETKQLVHKRVRYAVSHVMGVTANFVSDVEVWWAAQSFYYKTDSAATAAAEDL